MKKLLSNLNEAVPWLNIGVQRLLILVSVILLTPIWLMGQQQTVSGTITDDTGEPVPGANILIKGTSTGTVSDFDGNYSLNVSSEDVLVISSVGFLSQEIVVGDQSVIDLVLSTDILYPSVYNSLQMKKALTNINS
jgi:hypothetical protein